MAAGQCPAACPAGQSQALPTLELKDHQQLLARLESLWKYSFLKNVMILPPLYLVANAKSRVFERDAGSEDAQTEEAYSQLGEMFHLLAFSGTNLGL